jgi:hypothetical protein
MAVRASLAELLARPAERVERIMIVRPDRRAAPPELAEVKAAYPQAEFWGLLGSSGEGESRSGKPWPDCRSLQWHRWNQVMPQWFAASWRTVGSQPHAERPFPAAPCAADENASDPAPHRSVGVLSAGSSVGHALAELLSGAGHTVVELTSTASRRSHNLELMIWDDTAAPPADEKEWSRRRRRAEWNVAGNNAAVRRTRHLWLANFPRHQDIEAARRGGIDATFSKPVGSAALLSWVQRLGCSEHR